MSVESQPTNSYSRSKKYTSLRDYGAFQNTERSALSTQQMLSSGLAQGHALQIPAVQATPMSVTQLLSRYRATSVLHVVQNKRLRLGLRIIMTVGLLFMVARAVSWPTVFNALGYIHKSMLMIACVVGAGGVVLSAYQWRVLLRAAQLRVDLADLIKLYIVGIAFNHLLPTGMGGDALKIWYVGRGKQARIRSLGATVVCRMTGFCGMLLIALPVVLIWHDRFDTTLCLWFGLLAALLGLGIVGMYLLVTLLPHMSRERWSNSVVLTKLVQICSVFSTHSLQPRTILIAIGCGSAFWVVAILNCYCYAHALGLVLPVSFFCIAVPFIALVSFLPISLNGFGLREAAFIYVFSTVHVSSSQALLLALFQDLQAALFALLGGYIYFTFIKTRHPLDEGGIQ